jgi:hypothetical protein
MKSFVQGLRPANIEPGVVLFHGLRKTSTCVNERFRFKVNGNNTIGGKMRWTPNVRQPEPRLKV